MPFPNLLYSAAGGFSRNAIANARCTLLFNYVRVCSTQKRLFIEVNAISVPEKINA